MGDEDRAKAAVIIEALREAKIAFKKGERNAAVLTQIVEDRLKTEPSCEIDYISIIDRDSLQPIEKVDDNEALICAAVTISGVRLIDNVILNRKQ